MSMHIFTRLQLFSGIQEFVEQKYVIHKLQLFVLEGIGGPRILFLMNENYKLSLKSLMRLKSTMTRQINLHQIYINNKKKN